MQDRILKLIGENPRTAKELADSLGVSKQKMIDLLETMPVKKIQLISRNGKSQPLIFYKYTL
jgi:DNA-binding IclR family transcriptional regulator